MLYCIYTIISKTNNKIYVGYTSDFFNRKRRHLDCLRRNEHVNSYLQSAFNKYGEENFDIEILLYCTKETAYSEEHYWCNLLNSHNRNFGYNIAPTNPNKINSKQSKETVQKRINSLTGRILSDSHVENLKFARLGTKNSKESIEKVKKWFKENGHPSKGIKRSEKTRNNISLATKGKPRENRKKKLICIEEESKVLLFESIEEILLHYKISTFSLYKNLKKESSFIITKSNIKINVLYDN